MDNVKNIEEIEKYHEQVKELFKEFAAEELYEKWADTFEIADIDKKRVTVTYHGIDDIKVFKKECKETLISCICSAIGDGKKIKISKKKGYRALSPQVKKNINAVKFFVIGMVFVCIAAAVLPPVPGRPSPRTPKPASPSSASPAAAAWKPAPPARWPLPSGPIFKGGWTRCNTTE